MAQEGYLEQGYHIDRYHALEGDLLRFLDFVNLEFYPSIEERKSIKSLYLGDLLLRIGSNIDIFFRKIISNNSDEPKFNEIFGKIERLNWDKFKKLEPYLKLSNVSVTIISTSENLYPFREGGKQTGESWSEKSSALIWWTCYNKIKHEGLFEGATLDNVIQALAALFFLITIEKEKYTEKLNRYGYTPGYGYLLNPNVISEGDTQTKLFKAYSDFFEHRYLRFRLDLSKSKKIAVQEKR